MVIACPAPSRKDSSGSQASKKNMPTDKIPLNRSFETKETSDTYSDGESYATGQINIWKNQTFVHKSTEKIQTKKGSMSISSSAETEIVKNTDIGRNALGRSTDNSNKLTITHYSPSLDVMFESLDGKGTLYSDEDEPRASVLPLPFATFTKDIVSHAPYDEDAFDETGIEVQLAAGYRSNGSTNGRQKHDIAPGGERTNINEDEVHDRAQQSDSHTVPEENSIFHLSLQSCIRTKKRRRACCAIFALLSLCF